MRPICFAILMIVAVPAVPGAWASQTPGAPVVDPSLALSGPADEGAGNPDPGVVDDPHADRGILLPTALTQPAGTVSISSYELLLAGLTVGITDRLQASVTGLVPVLGIQAVLGNVKFQLLHQGAVRLALNGGVSYTRSSEDDHHDHPGAEEPGNHQVMPHLGASLSLCLTDDCQSLLSASVQFLTNPTGRSLGQTDAGYGASLIMRISEHTKLVLEANSNAELNPSPHQAASVMATGALRYFNKQVALDGGIIGLVDAYGTILPVPYVAGSVRF
jgi:hypothetical protein